MHWLPQGKPIQRPTVTRPARGVLDQLVVCPDDIELIKTVSKEFPWMSLRIVFKTHSDAQRVGSRISSRQTLRMAHVAPLATEDDLQQLRRLRLRLEAGQSGGPSNRRRLTSAGAGLAQEHRWLAGNFGDSRPARPTSKRPKSKGARFGRYGQR